MSSSLIQRAAATLLTAALMLSGPRFANAATAHAARVVTTSNVAHQQGTARSKQASGQQADTTTIDSTQSAAPDRATQANPPITPASTNSGPWKVGLIVIFLTLIAAGYLGFRIITGPRPQAHEQDIPIVFEPRGEPRAVAELPGGRARAPAMQVSPAQTHDGNHKARVAENSTHGVSGNPVQGTLQLLPGRLEVTAGMPGQKEIRFVRVPGKPEVTFGRYPGEAHTHIQVSSPTVSRKHASMRFHLNRWHITNLSSTNPVVVNGEPLPADEERLLMDGDQVEMGEVIFRFRAR